MTENSILRLIQMQKTGGALRVKTQKQAYPTISPWTKEVRINKTGLNTSVKGPTEQAIF